MASTTKTTNFVDLRKSIAELAGRVRELRRQIETKRREREDIQSAPPCKQDVLDMLAAWVDRSAESATSNIETMLGGFLRKPQALVDDGKVAGGIALLAAPSGAGVTATLQSADSMLCALFGAELKAALPGMLDRVAWPADPGLPLVERAERVAVIDRELAALEEDEKELAAQAAAAGINLGGVYYA